MLVSHDNHPDNLDGRGRALALAVPLVLTTGSGARRLGQPAIDVAVLHAGAARVRASSGTAR